ncbi:MAG: MaoC/PaaZ C-terminal domain-containing protein [Burkholderiaceae bacterium]
MLTLATLPGLTSSLLGALAPGKARLAHDQPLPAIALRVSAVALAPARLEAYRRFFGFAAPLPLAWLYLPAQRAQLALLNRREFPLGAAGLIHVANSIQSLAAVTAVAPIAITIRLGQQNTRRSGRQFDLDTEIEQDGRVKALIRSTYLARAPRAARTAPSATSRSAASEGESLAVIAVPSSLGLSYARLSGDWNPIHLHRWGARPFGLAQPIAHGMCVAATALSALEKREGRCARQFDAQFLLPVPLGSSAECLGVAAATPGATSAHVMLAGRCAQIIRAQF